MSVRGCLHACLLLSSLLIVGAVPIDEEDHTVSAEGKKTSGKLCKGWCNTLPKVHPAKKCSWSKCEGCDYCANIVLPCKGWCAGNKQPAAKKCSWVALCGGCNFCNPPPPSPPPPPPRKSPPPPARVVQPKPLSKGPSSAYDYVAAHNKLRARHCGTSPLQFSAALEAEAKAFAATCPTGHASNAARGGHGENLMWSASQAYTCTEPACVTRNFELAMNTWYHHEARSYNFDTGAMTGVTGHLLQILWKPTTHVGCAVQAGSCMTKFKVVENSIIVCRYSPGGNTRDPAVATQYVGRPIASGACSAAGSANVTAA